MNLPLLTSRSRVMLFAPHPDDESLATGVFLQRAVSAGAAVRVVYATDGERNCWPQRLLERKVFLRAKDRRRWGARRRGEALNALDILGLRAHCVDFLNLPDQGVTDLLLDGCGATLRRLAHAIRTWRPTHLVMPSAADTHPDHSGLAVLLGIALDDYLPPMPQLTRMHYLVHGDREAFSLQASEFPSSVSERARKRRAIRCHQTQVALSPRRFLAYAERSELFIVGDQSCARPGEKLIRSCRRESSHLSVEVDFPFKPFRFRPPSLYFIAYNDAGLRRHLRATLPERSCAFNLTETATGSVVAGQYFGDALRGRIVLPLDGFTSAQPICFKIDRRVSFWDEAGWSQIPATLAEAPARRALAVA